MCTVYCLNASEECNDSKPMGNESTVVPCLRRKLANGSVVFIDKRLFAYIITSSPNGKGFQMITIDDEGRGFNIVSRT